MALKITDTISRHNTMFKSKLYKQKQNNLERTMKSLHRLLNQSNLNITKTLKDLNFKQKTNTNKPKQANKRYGHSILCTDYKSEFVERSLKRKTKEVVSDAEYYPNKGKRNVLQKRVILKPKYESMVVASTNKRKRRTPQRDTEAERKQRKSNKPQQNKDVESSDDSISSILDDQSLTEEDLMEILTCPSPVWWEDPPDDNINEDAIKIYKLDTSNEQLNDIEETEKLSETVQTDIQTDTNKTNNNTITFKLPTDGKFIVKRSKLEGILGNLKIKSVSNDASVQTPKENWKNSVDSDSSFDEDELMSLENIDIPIRDSDRRESIEILDKTNVNNKNNEQITKNNSPIKKTIKTASNKDVLKIKCEQVAKILEDTNREENKLIAITSDNKVTEKSIKSDGKINVDDKNNIINEVIDLDNYVLSNKQVVKRAMINKVKKLSLAKLVTPKINRKSNGDIAKMNLNGCKNVANNIFGETDEVDKVFGSKYNSSFSFDETTRVLHGVDVQKNVKILDPEVALRISKRLNLGGINSFYKKTKATSSLLKRNIKTPAKKLEKANLKTKVEMNKSKTDDSTLQKETFDIADDMKVTLVSKPQEKVDTSPKLKPFRKSKNRLQKKALTNINSDPVPECLPKLTKFPKKPTPVSPKSNKGVSSEGADTCSDADTISDRNVKYIDEYDDRRSKNNDDLVIVYKILNKNDDASHPDSSASKVSPSKKSRKSDLKSSNNADYSVSVKKKESSNKGPFIKLPQSNMKYCCKCSTIFDTDTCQYCVKMAQSQNNVEINTSVIDYV